MVHTSLGNAINEQVKNQLHVAAGGYSMVSNPESVRLESAAILFTPVIEPDLTGASDDVTSTGLRGMLKKMDLNYISQLICERFDSK